MENCVIPANNPGSIYILKLLSALHSSYSVFHTACVCVCSPTASSNFRAENHSASSLCFEQGSWSVLSVSIPQIGAGCYQV